MSEFLQDPKRRGLGDPLLATTDGAGGLIRAVEEVLPRSERQRCLAHKMRNLQRKVPDEQWPEFRAAAAASYQAPSPAMVRLLHDDLTHRYQKTLPGATACFLDDFDACIAHLRFPLDHSKAIRTTNLLERLFEEERRRTKVMPHAFGERALIKAMYAATIRASALCRGIKITPFEQRQLQIIRQELAQAFQQRHASATTGRLPS